MVLNLFKINWLVYEDMFATPDVIARKILYYYNYDLGKKYFLISKELNDTNKTLLKRIDEELDINKDFEIILAISNEEIMKDFNIKNKALGELNKALINNIIEHPGLNNKEDLTRLINKYIDEVKRC